MSATTPIAKRFDKPDRPCPCCGASSRGCSATDDGLHLCRGEPSRDDWREISRGPDKAGFRHYRRADEPRPERNGFHGNGRRAAGGAGVSTTASRSKPQPAIDWAALNAELVANLTQEDAADLAGSLRLPVEALAELEVGVEWIGETRVFTFPEQNGRGETVGISRRYPDGTKRMIPGSRRGLSIPRSFRDRGGDTFVVEGSTCMLAGSAAGLRIVGRPSNVGGVEDLAELLAGIDRGREIVIVGERDQKPDGKWPGKEGAESTAKAIGEKLGRPVRVAFPPDGYKDARDRIADLIADAGEVLDLAAIGREFVGSLQYAPSAAGGRWRFKPVGAATFASGDYRPVWAVKRLFVLGQPGLICGVHKSLKTMTAIDLCVSLATGTNFLGEFPVPRKLKTMLLSGESGMHTIQDAARRICQARGIDLADVENLYFQFDLPQLGTLDDLTELIRGIVDLGIEFLVLDPAYLLLLAGATNVDAKSIFDMGSHLRSIATLCQQAGCTVILVHHSNRQIQTGAVMELANVAFAGFAEFARQWLLLSRAEAYTGNGEHSLHMNVGGSCGQGGLYSVRVSEGVLDEQFGGRKWEVNVQSADTAKADHAVERERAKSDAARKKLQEEERLTLEAIDFEVESGQPGANSARIKMKTGFSGTKVKDVVERLLELQAIEEIEFEKPSGNGAMKSVTGYRRAGK